MIGKKNEYTGMCKYDVNTRRQDLSPAVTVGKPSYDPLIEAYEIINSLYDIINGYIYVLNT